jgi:hypothetical protein
VNDKAGGKNGGAYRAGGGGGGAYRAGGGNGGAHRALLNYHEVSSLLGESLCQSLNTALIER